MRRDRGYSLVELLLALLVFSLGAMAVAAMQLGAVQATRSASDAAAALLLAEDLLQRMLANPAGLDVYVASLGDGDADPGAGGDCADAGLCAARARAQRDITAWRRLGEQRSLAELRACVRRQADALQVSLSWSARAAGGVDPQHSCRGEGDGDDGSRRAVTLRAPVEATP